MQMYLRMDWSYLGKLLTGFRQRQDFPEMKKTVNVSTYISGGFASLHITRYLECQEIWNYMNQLIGSIVMQDTGVKIERDVFDGELSFRWVDVLARFLVFVWQLPLRLFCLFAFFADLSLSMSPPALFCMFVCFLLGGPGFVQCLCCIWMCACVGFFALVQSQTAARTRDKKMAAMKTSSTKRNATRRPQISQHQWHQKQRYNSSNHIDSSNKRSDKPK